MKALEFKPLDEYALGRLDHYVKEANYIGSDYSYFGYLIWFDQVEYAEGDRALFLRAYFDGKLRYWQPLVSDGMTVAQAIEQLPPRCEFFNCTKDVAEQLSEDYFCDYNRDYSEYIYLAEDFISLSGKRYNAKRNHIHKFKSLYNYEMRPYNAADRDEVLEFEERWLKTHIFDDENAENSALIERKIMFAAVDASLDGRTICELLRVDGVLAGFSVAEKTPCDSATVIYEKADTRYDGVYSFLAHEFAARNFAGLKYINRQEDMGLEGLRKSKLSYCPEFLLDKFVLRPKKGENATREGMLNDKYAYGQLNAEQFNDVMGFLKKGILSLSDKKFFLNYTDDELLGVLDRGYMLGAFDRDKLIATVGVDSDREYGNMLAKICHDESGRQFYEFSGIMVDEDHRRQGVSGALCAKVLQWAKLNVPGSTLCAVVQRGNTPSLENLRKLGFVLRAEAPYKQYDFLYLTLEV